MSEQSALAEIRIKALDFSTYADENIVSIIEEESGFVSDYFTSEQILKEVKLAKKDMFSHHFENTKN